MYEFDKTRRLLKKSHYDHVFSKSKKLVSHEFIVFYCDNSVGCSRLGLALSKKMIAKAHDRNRVKRALRETFRINVNLPAIDIIVLARLGTGRINSASLNKLLCGVWNKLSALHEK